MNDDQWRQIASAFANEAGDAAACRLCSACIDVLAVTGAGITLMDGDQTGPLCVTGHGAAELEELQFTLGEGPCHDAYRLGEPVLVHHLDSEAPTRWLPFAELATRTGIGAVFAYPLICDETKLGVLTLYRRRAGSLELDQQDAAQGLADVIAETLMTMHYSSRLDHLASGFDDAVAHRAEIHQASGMVASRLQIPVAEALIRIRAHAYASGQPVSTIAADIIARRLHLEDDRNDLEGVEQ